jgi:hypothetical protein
MDKLDENDNGLRTICHFFKWRPRQIFHYRRGGGVRQGDPLSPLLFVLLADLLQSIVDSALQNGLLSLRTLLILEACPRHLITLKSLLNTFAESTGLKVNYQKSNIYPLNVDLTKMEIIARTFDCQIGNYLFTYLGLPMGPYKPKTDEFLPLVQRIERRLLSTSMFLNHAGRLVMVNSVLSALPTFYKQIDKYRKHYIRRGVDMNARKPPLGAWNLATNPREMGALVSSICHLKRTLCF